MISSCIITRNDLSDFILSFDGVIGSDDGLFGRISRGERHIWIGLAKEELDVVYGDNSPEYIKTLSLLLKGPPQTYVVVEISRTDGSERLALEFAIKFTERWMSVVDDLQENLLEHDELVRRYSNYQGIRILS